MARTTPAERAQKVLEAVDGRIAAFEDRKKAAIAKVEQRYEQDLAALRAEREHAASHPALQPSDGPAAVAAAAE